MSIAGLCLLFGFVLLLAVVVGDLVVVLVVGALGPLDLNSLTHSVAIGPVAENPPVAVQYALGHCVLVHYLRWINISHGQHLRRLIKFL